MEMEHLTRKLQRDRKRVAWRLNHLRHRRSGEEKIYRHSRRPGKRISSGNNVHRTLLVILNEIDAALDSVPRDDRDSFPA